MVSAAQQGRAAFAELEQTDAAFDAVRGAYVKQALAAESMEAAWAYILQARALDDAKADLRRVIDAGKVDEKFQPE